jgi:hypothetical protein
MSQIWPLMNNSDHLQPRVNTHTLLITPPLFQSASWAVCARPSVPSTAAPSPCANAVWARRCQLVSSLRGAGQRSLARSLGRLLAAAHPQAAAALRVSENLLQTRERARALDFCLIALINFASLVAESRII